MNTAHNLKRIAKKLVELSFENGIVSEERVRACLRSISGYTLHEHKTILRLYLHLLERAVRESELLIEYAGNIGPETIEKVRLAISKLANHQLKAEVRENKKLIAGIRLRLGDNFYDNSIQGRLKRLSVKN